MPRVLRMYHDTPGESGISPYQIVFGRERNLAGVPYVPLQECEDAQTFFDRMEALDQRVAAIMNQKHAVSEGWINAHRRAPEPYQPGDWVWVETTREWTAEA